MRTHETRTPVLAPVPDEPSLVVGHPRDGHEIAADRLADAVVGGRATVRRSAVSGGGGGGGGDSGGALDADTSDAIDAARHGGSPLRPATRTPLEGGLGADLSRVRVHTDRGAGELCDSLRAHAFTVGSHIFFRRGHPDASTPAGRHLLAHELAHVTQRPAADVIRRAYIETPAEWRRDTRVVRAVIGGVKPRSAEMVDIDDALARCNDAYWHGDVRGLHREITLLLAAIGTWRAKRRPTATRVRGEKVDDLQGEAEALAGEIALWRGARYRTALDQHRADRRKVLGWFEAARTQNGQTEEAVRLRNSCEWVHEGRAHLYVVTETGDHAYRAKVRRRPGSAAGYTTYFPDPDSGRGALDTQHPQADVSTNVYDKDDADSTRNVAVNERINGWNRPGKVVLTEFGIGAEYEFHQVLRHEVQHDADKHRTTPIAAGPPAATTRQEAVREYKTEYRAHFYQASRNFTDLTHDVNQLTVHREDLDWTPRQWAIFSKIRQDYPRIRAAALEPQFVADVNAYRNPDTEGFNKYNSPRIDRLNAALHNVPLASNDPADRLVATLLGTVDRLDHRDALYLQDGSQSLSLRDKVGRHLRSDALAEFVHRLQER